MLPDFIKICNVWFDFDVFSSESVVVTGISSERRIENTEVSVSRVNVSDMSKTISFSDVSLGDLTGIDKIKVYVDVDGTLETTGAGSDPNELVDLLNTSVVTDPGMGDTGVNQHPNTYILSAADLAAAYASEGLNSPHQLKVTIDDGDAAYTLSLIHI